LGTTPIQFPSESLSNPLINTKPAISRGNRESEFAEFEAARKVLIEVIKRLDGSTGREFDTSYGPLSMVSHALEVLRS
jgi:hypothetical protein